HVGPATPWPRQGFVALPNEFRSQYGVRANPTSGTECPGPRGRRPSAVVRPTPVAWFTELRHGDPLLTRRAGEARSLLAGLPPVRQRLALFLFERLGVVEQELESSERRDRRHGHSLLRLFRT